jgi:hypothetical protein
MFNITKGTMLIGGKERPYQINGTRQTRQFCETYGIELNSYWQIMSEFAADKPLTNAIAGIVYVWSALYAGAIRAYRTCDFTYDDVIDWVEDMESAEEMKEAQKPFLALKEAAEQKKS